MSLVNLLPEDFILRRAARRTNAIALVMFAVVMAGTLAGVSVNQRSVNSTQEVLAHVTGEYQNAAKVIEKLNYLDKTKKLMQEKTRVTGSLVEHQPKSYVLALVTNSLPETACVTSLKMAIKKVTIQPDKNAPKPARGQKPEVKKDIFFTEMEIIGLATTDLDVSMLMEKLSASPLIDKVDLVYSQDKQIDIKSPVTEKVVEQRVFRDFKLRVALSPDVDVMDILTDRGEFAMFRGTGVSPVSRMGVSPMQHGLGSGVLESAWAAAVWCYETPAHLATGETPVRLMGGTPMLRKGNRI